MATRAELYQKFASFPNKGHVEAVCKPGQGAATCRYLSVDPQRPNGEMFSCQKYGTLREAIDERVKEGTMRAQGDNCGGLVEFMQQNQSDLEGNSTHYVERMPTIELDGTFDGITAEKGNVHMGELAISEDFALLEVRQDGITLTARGVGAFVGEQTVYFEKPRKEETPAA